MSRVELSRQPCLSVRFPAATAAAAAASNIGAINQTGNEARNVGQRLGDVTACCVVTRHLAADGACANCRHRRVRLAITWT